MAVPETDVLGIFAKWPEPGRVKTRLAIGASPGFAIRVAESFLADTLERLQDFPARRLVAYTPPERELDFIHLIRGRFELTPQGEGDLGRRMADFFRARFSEGSKHVVLLGTDSPTVPIDYIHQAFQKLKDADLVLGPALDGGYYLIGCKTQMPAVFDGITWGQSNVLAETLNRISSDVRLALLPPWYDVDSVEAWNMLRGHIVALRRCGSNAGAPRTERLACMPTTHLHWTIDVSTIPMAFREALFWVAANGFTEIQLSLTTDLSPADLNALADSGLFVVSAVLPADAALVHPDAKQRRKATKELAGRLTAAARLGATVCLVAAGPPSTDQDQLLIREACTVLAAQATAQFMRLCVPALAEVVPPMLGHCWTVGTGTARDLPGPLDHVSVCLAENPDDATVAAVRYLRTIGYSGPVVISTVGDWRLLPQMLARLEKAAFIDLSPE